MGQGGSADNHPNHLEREAAMAVGSVGGATSGSSVSVLDPRDLNRDGKVTEVEIQQYNQVHPQADTAEATQEKSNHLLDVTV